MRNPHGARCCRAQASGEKAGSASCRRLSRAVLGQVPAGRQARCGHEGPSLHVFGCLHVDVCISLVCLFYL